MMKNKSRGISIVLLFIILLLGFFLRSKPYFYGSFNYFIDQSRDLLLTKQIVVDHHFPLIGARAGIGGIFHGPIWLYMIAPFFYLAKGDPFYTLVPLFLIINLLPILLAFLVGFKLYDKKTGLIWALLVASASTLIGGSFNTSNSQIMPIIFILYLFFIIHFLRGKEIYFALILFLIGLAFHFESAFAVFLIPLTILALVFKRKLPKFKTIIYGFILSILSVSNFLLFEVRHQFLMTHSVLKLFSGSMEPLRGYEKFARLDYRIYDRLLGLKDYFFTPLFQSNSIFVLLVSLILLLSIYFLINKVKRIKRLGQEEKEYIFILLIPFLYYLIYVFYPFPLWPQYTSALTISACLLLALSVRNIQEHIKSNILVGKRLVSLFLILIAIPPLFWIQINYLGSQAKEEPYKNYKEQLEVAKYIFKDSPEKKEVGYFVYDSGLLTYNMDYLMWYLGNKYGVKTVNEKLPTTYLILSPPPKWDQGAQEYWIKNVIRTTGSVVARKKFNNNMIVEKLNIPPNEPPPDPNYFQNLIFR